MRHWLAIRPFGRLGRRLQGQVEVCSGVAVGDRIDVERVDLLARLGQPGERGRHQRRTTFASRTGWPAMAGPPRAHHLAWRLARAADRLERHATGEHSIMDLGLGLRPGNLFRLPAAFQF